MLSARLILLLIGNICYGLLVPSVRPPVDERTYQSNAINDLIDGLIPLIQNKDLAILLSNCLPNTLDTTVSFYSNGEDANSTLDSFIVTGDINALWLRDSTNQVLPYIPYAPIDADLQSLLEGLISRQARSVAIDPYANAFNFNASNAGHQTDRRTPPMSPEVFEGKYEIDSLCAFLKLSYWHWRYSGDESLQRFITNDWIDAVSKLLDTVETMQHDDGRSSNPPYLFQRTTSQALDTLMISGRGPPAKLTGLTRSLFRPSDDAVTLPYNIPGNAMACIELTHLQELITVLMKNNTSEISTRQIEEIASQTKRIRDPLCSALQQIIESNAATSSPLPYEIDGFGAEYYMDDANIPSLLSLPVLGYMSSTSDVYKATRNMILSPQNPYYFSGTEANGIGGPHVGFNYSWPMAIVTRAMTSDDDREILECLNMLIASSAGTGLMHESFNVNNVNDYTREWFAWANGLFGDLILLLIETKPHLILLQGEQYPAALEKAQSLVYTPISLLAQREVLVL